VNEKLSKPYDWLTQLPDDAANLDQTPLAGIPSFSWTSFSKEISTLFEIHDLNIKPSNTWKWRQAGSLFEGLGTPVDILDFSISSFGGEVLWAMSRQDLDRLVSLLLSAGNQPEIPVIDPDFRTGFYEFIALEAIHAFKTNDSSKKIHPKLESSKEGHLPEEDCLTLDIEITALGQVFSGCLLLTKTFQENWKAQFADRTLKKTLSERLGLETDVLLQITAGNVTLNSDDVKKISPGDFLFLDTCTLDPQTNLGKGLLLANHRPYFNLSFEKDSIKIVDKALYYEVPSTMNAKATNDDHDSENDDEILEDSEFDDEDDDTFGDTDLEDSTFDTEEETFTESSTFDQDDIEEEKVIAPLKSPIKEAPKPQAKPATASPAPVAGAKSPPIQVEKNEGRPVPVEELPLSIHVEVGRLSMTLQNLSELQPGSLLKMSVRPEDGVNLVVNGQTIAKGELLKIGDSLGVRILDI